MCVVSLCGPNDCVCVCVDVGLEEEMPLESPGALGLDAGPLGTLSVTVTQSRARVFTMRTRNLFRLGGIRRSVGFLFVISTNKQQQKQQKQQKQQQQRRRHKRQEMSRLRCNSGVYGEGKGVGVNMGEGEQEPFSQS